MKVVEITNQAPLCNIIKQLHHMDNAYILKSPPEEIPDNLLNPIGKGIFSEMWSNRKLSFDQIPIFSYQAKLGWKYYTTFSTIISIIVKRA